MCFMPDCEIKGDTGINQIIARNTEYTIYTEAASAVCDLSLQKLAKSWQMKINIIQILKCFFF